MNPQAVVLIGERSPRIGRTTSHTWPFPLHTAHRTVPEPLQVLQSRLLINPNILPAPLQGAHLAPPLPLHVPQVAM